MLSEMSDRKNQILYGLTYLLLFSCPAVSDSLQAHGLQHARPLCLLPSPKAGPSSCPLPWWCHPVISYSDALFSLYPQFFPASGSFPMSHQTHQNWFASDDQNSGASTSASVVSTSIQGWLSCLISLLSKGLSGVFSSTTVQKHQILGVLYSLRPSSLNCTWPLGRPQPWLYGSLLAE